MAELPADVFPDVFPVLPDLPELPANVFPDLPELPANVFPDLPELPANVFPDFPELPANVFPVVPDVIPDQVSQNLMRFRLPCRPRRDFNPKFFQFKKHSCYTALLKMKRKKSLNLTVLKK